MRKMLLTSVLSMLTMISVAKAEVLSTFDTPKQVRAVIQDLESLPSHLEFSKKVSPYTSSGYQVSALEFSLESKGASRAAECYLTITLSQGQEKEQIKTLIGYLHSNNRYETELANEYCK